MSKEREYLMPLVPIKMTPAFRHGSQTPWGGDGLAAFGKHIPDARTGESLEVSALPGLESRDEQGRTLTELLRAYGAAMRGTTVGETFPLLLKLISAQDWLSVQVHPDDAYAAAREGGKLGKTEAWVILSAEPGAKIVYGIRQGVTGEMLAQACKEGGERITACLNTIEVKPGEVYYIPAGMVHAIGAGITLMEIQQSSDVTYRFYDWNRVDAQGRGRALHVEKGLDVITPQIHLEPCGWQGVPCEGGTIETAIRVHAFTLQRLNVCGCMPLGDSPERFRVLCAMGDIRLAWPGGGMRLRRGDSVFLPAAARGVQAHGEAQLLMCTPGAVPGDYTQSAH